MEEETRLLLVTGDTCPENLEDCGRGFVSPAVSSQFPPCPLCTPPPPLLPLAVSPPSLSIFNLLGLWE